MARPKTLPDGERISITIPEDLLASLRNQAESRRISLSMLTGEVIRKGLDDRRSTAPLEDRARTSITIPEDLLTSLRSQAECRSISLSMVIEDVIRKGLDDRPSTVSPEERARTFPSAWDGKDLRQRLIDLRIRQKDLAAKLSAITNYPVGPSAVSNWVLGKTAVPEFYREPIQKALIAWDPATNPRFTIGSRSMSE